MKNGFALYNLKLLNKGIKEMRTIIMGLTTRSNKIYEFVLEEDNEFELI